MEDAVKTAQTCKHDYVLHWTGDLESSAITYPKRICLSCGLEEEGGWWCYSAPHWYNGQLLETWGVRDWPTGTRRPDPVLGIREGRTIKVTSSFDEFRRVRRAAVTERSVTLGQ